MRYLPPRLILNWSQVDFIIFLSREEPGVLSQQMYDHSCILRHSAVISYPCSLSIKEKTDAIRSTTSQKFGTSHILPIDHWSTEEMMKDYLNHVLFPYIDGVRTSYGLESWMTTILPWRFLTTVNWLYLIHFFMSSHAQTHQFSVFFNDNIYNLLSTSTSQFFQFLELLR